MALIDTARRLTADEGLDDNVSYDVGDAHHTPYDDDEFDVVTLHTVISHVDDPHQVLREAVASSGRAERSPSSTATTPHSPSPTPTT